MTTIPWPYRRFKLPNWEYRAHNSQMSKVTRQQFEDRLPIWEHAEVGEMPGGGSVVARRGLGRKLKALRLASGKDWADVTETGIMSKSKLHRTETGAASIRVSDVIALCRLYGADPDTTEGLIKMAPATSSRDDFTEGVQPGWHSVYLGLEAVASRLRAVEEVVVHGLVQTEDYARVITAAEPGITDDVVEQRVRLRLERQRRVLGKVPDLTVILSEAALSRVVGSPEIMTVQVDHLRKLDQDGVATVRVIPFSAGAVPSRGPFHMVELADDDDPNLVYVEGAGTAKYLDKPADWADYETVWQILADKSTPIGAWER